MEVKFHSRLAAKHIKTISDNTEISRLRDIEHRSKLIDKLSVQLPESYLNDILLEIAINLRRNTPPKGKVRISASRSGDGANNFKAECRNRRWESMVLEHFTL